MVTIFYAKRSNISKYFGNVSEILSKTFCRYSTMFVFAGMSHMYVLVYSFSFTSDVTCLRKIETNVPKRSFLFLDEGAKVINKA